MERSKVTFNEWLKQITDTIILKFARKEELTFEEVSFLVNGCYDKNIILKQDIQEKHGKVIIIKYIFFVPDLKKYFKIIYYNILDEGYKNEWFPQVADEVQPEMKYVEVVKWN